MLGKVNPTKFMHSLSHSKNKNVDLQMQLHFPVEHHHSNYTRKKKKEGILKHKDYRGRFKKRTKVRVHRPEATEMEYHSKYILVEHLGF